MKGSVSLGRDAVSSRCVGEQPRVISSTAFSGVILRPPCQAINTPNNYFRTAPIAEQRHDPSYKIRGKHIETFNAEHDLCPGHPART